MPGGSNLPSEEMVGALGICLVLQRYCDVNDLVLPNEITGSFRWNFNLI